MIKTNKTHFKNCAIFSALLLIWGLIPTNVLASDITKENNILKEKANDEYTVTSDMNNLSTFSESSKLKTDLLNSNKASTNEINSELAIDTDSMSQTLNSSNANISYSVIGTPKVGNEITIVVNISSVSNLYGASVDFKYDTSLLKIEDKSISQGSIFAGKTTKVPVNEVKNGQVHIAMSLIGETPSINGSGVLATIKAKVLKPGTINLKSTNIYKNLTSSNYNTCVKLSTINGEKISYGYTNLNLTIDKVTSYEENNSLIKYSGSWINDSNSSNSGKSAKYSGSTGSSFTFSFKGTGFAWYGFANPSKGIANIYIDNKKIQQNTYSATAKYQSLFYENRSLAAGKHTVKIEVAETKYVNVDKIDIFNGSMISTDKVTSYEENNSLIKYSGSWINDSNSSNSGKSAKYSGSTGSSFTFSFNGTGFAWYGFANPSKGTANIYIDNKKIQQNTYSATAKYQSLFYENRSLAAGKHTVKIEVAETKYVNVDKIDIFNGSMISTDTVTSYEENNPLIKYSGSWINDSNSSNSGKSAKYSGSTGSSFTFSFNGTGFAWYGFANPSKGIANIYIDNKKIQQNTYSATAKYQSLFYENRSLAAGKHTVKIEVAETKYVNVDKIDIFNGSMISTDTVTSYEENNPLIKYSGSWINDSNSSNSGKSAKYSGSTGSSFTFSFNGTGFAWYGFANPSKGIANIYIDNKKIQQNTYSATAKYQSLFYENRSLAAGKHTVKIEVAETKYVNVDKIDIFNGSMIS